jgi:glycosyltransferase involved in cell wall biosynthesis
VYNEQEVLATFHARLSAVLDTLELAAEIIYVNDGSRDASLTLLKKLKGQDPRVALLDLSRNFGKEIAMTAGLDHAKGEAIVIIDADLQDPPELIPELIARWRDGHDVVYAQRTVRDGESWFKRCSAFLFYRTMQRLVHGVHIPADTGDFRLLSRRAVEALGQVRERHRFMKGLFAWIGFAQTAVPYRRQPRHAGSTKWNYLKLWNFALEGITSFSSLPLRFATYAGSATALFAFVYGTYVVTKTLLFGEAVAGYPSLMAVITFLGGMQLAAIGILGEYVGRMSDEAKQRPLYLINEYLPVRTASSVSKARRVTHKA